MRFAVFTYLILICFVAKGQTITRIAGGGTGGDGGAATAASIYDPNSIVFDDMGNLYFSEPLGGKVRKIDTFGVISTVAGDGSTGYFGDGGSATNAKFNQPTGLAIDSISNLYIADANNHVVRKLSLTTGIIKTVCGNGIQGFGGDGGTATSAMLNSPIDVKFDIQGNLYVACRGCIRRVNSSGIITTIAGIGTTWGYTGDGGPATSANIFACNIWVASNGDVYMTDLQNVVIRKVLKSSGLIVKVAGDSAQYTYNGDGIPATAAHIDPEGLAFDRFGRMYIGDRINNRVRMIDNSGIIYTVAGNGTSGSSGDGGPATAAELAWPENITFDKCDNLYISHVNFARIRKVAFNPDPCLHLAVEKIEANTISIYPNPTENELHVDNVITNVEYVLLNITGIIEQTGTLKEGSNSVPVGSLPAGLHMLVLIDEEGRKIVEKIVKE